MIKSTTLRPKVFTLFLMLLTFFFQQPSLMATNGIRIVDGISSDGSGTTVVAPPPTILNGCELAFSLSFWIANLNTAPLPIQGNSNEGNPETNDNGPGPIYVQYSIGDDFAFFPLDLNSAYYFEDVNGEPVFQIDYQFTTSLSQECYSPLQKIYLEYSFRTASGSLYPISNFSAPGDLFPCTVFEENCTEQCNGVCNPNISSDPDWLKTFYVECCTCKILKDCEPLVALPYTGGEKQKNEEHPRMASPIMNNNDKLYNVFPNPFSTDFTVNIGHLQTNNLVVEAYDATGKLMLHSQRRIGPNTQNVNFPTTNWAKGIYYIKVHSDQGQEIFKLIKSD